MVECEKLTVKIDKKILVDDVSCKIPDGKLAVILGKNGSGKTTLLRAINQNIRYNGKVLVDGQDIKKMSLLDKAKLIATMPQSLPQPPVSLRKLVSFGRHPYVGYSGRLSPKDHQIVDELLAKHQLLDIADRRIDLCSGGERRKAFFAMMLCQQSKILLVDEPTANLDVPYVKHMLKALKACRLEGKTVITILHDINQAIELADIILVMDKGKLIFQGDAKQLMEDNIPEKVFQMQKIRCIEGDHEFYVFK